MRRILVALFALLFAVSAPGSALAAQTSTDQSKYKVAADTKKNKTKSKTAKVEGLVSLNTKSGKYHEPGCRYYGCGNCTEVPRSQAEVAGVPCKICH
jgi:uncharacterized protein YxeA